VRVAEINLQVSDPELQRLSSERTLALSLKEMKTLKAIAENPRVREERKKVGLGENLTDCEVEALAQTCPNTASTKFSMPRSTISTKMVKRGGFRACSTPMSGVPPNIFANPWDR